MPHRDIEDRRAYYRRYREKNREKCNASVNRCRKAKPALYKAIAKRARLKHDYGLTEADKQALAEAQGSACAICRRVVALVVDHDHQTNRVRGLLCSRCNTGLGKLGDGALLTAALSYLRKTES